MFKRLAIAVLLSVLALSARIGTKSGAKTYTFNLIENATAGSAQLKPGQYHLKVDGSQVVLIDKNGNPIEITATVQAGDRKFNGTSVTTRKTDGTTRIVSVECGGSTNRVVFEPGTE